MPGWVGLGLLAALAAAAVAVLGRVGLAGVDSTLATTLRSVVMTTLLLGFSASAAIGGRGRGPLEAVATLNGRAWLFVTLAGVCGAASWLAFFAALKLGPAGPVAALDRLSLPLVFLLGALFLGERPSAAGWAGLVLATFGIYLIAADGMRSSP